MTMTWILLHPDATPEHLGFLPSFLNDEDPTDAREQFDKNYAFGGWQPFAGDRAKLGEGWSLEYPDDPPLRPIAMVRLRDELVVVYDHSIVMVMQRGGDFEVARMD
jgi:hypothetical protein